MSNIEVVIRNWTDGNEIGDSSFVAILPQWSTSKWLVTWTPAEGFAADSKALLMQETTPNTIFEGQELTGHLTALLEAIKDKMIYPKYIDEELIVRKKIMRHLEEGFGVVDSAQSICSE